MVFNLNTMKQNYNLPIILSLLLFLPAFVKSQPVDRQEILGVSQNFFENRLAGAGISRTDLKPEISGYLVRDGRNLISIINFRDGGWVLTTTDQRFYPVLAYSFTGHFDAIFMPGNCNDWIMDYTRQMDTAIKSDGPFMKGMPEVWDRFLEDRFPKTDPLFVQPLVRSYWDQLGYQNRMCPADPDAVNGYAPVGCVPLAMAQLMYYYRYPETGSGQVTYTPSYHFGVYGEQTANFGATEYLWDEMTDICREENDAVAQLCYHAGVSVEVSYMPESSGAVVQDVPDALIQHFNYQADAYLPRADVSSTSEWATMLMEDMNHRRPVIYRSTSGFGGHVYLCDGYQDSTHFHFNWGWGGAYNGYFYIDDLTPGGIQINYLHGAVFNIYPDTTQFQYPVPVVSDTLTNTVGSIDDGSGSENYANNYSASWLIQPADSSITNLMIDFSMVDTEAGTDLIKIYKGSDTLSSPVLVWSGQNLPGSIEIFSPTAVVTFSSDSQNTANGFFLNYYGFHLPFCGETQVINDPTGILEDGSLYHNYRNNSDCSWLIAPEISPEDSISTVTIVFSHFNVASGDTLLVYDGDNNLAEKLGVFWNGSPPNVLNASGNKIYIEFKTDGQNVAQGWDAYWFYSRPDYCKDTTVFRSHDGEISDGSGPKNYVENTDCYFLIDIPNAESISLEVTGLELENDYDYVNIYDPNNPNQPLMKLTGMELPETMDYQLSSLLLHFHTDYAVNYQGFTLNYTASISGINKIEQDVSVYPNPAGEVFTIKSENYPLTGSFVTLMRTDGTPVFDEQMTGETQTFDLHKIPPGIYFIRIENSELTLTKKMIRR